MMNILWQWISGTKSTSLLLLCILGLGAAHLADGYALTAARRNLAQCQLHAEGLAASNASLLAALHAQQTAVAALEADGRRRKYAAQAVIRHAQAQRTTTRRSAQQWLAGDRKAGDECGRMQALLAGYLSHRRDTVGKQADK